MVMQTADDPNPNLVESKIRMLGELGNGATHGRRRAARLLVWLVLLSVPAGVLIGVLMR
jgi:hypothetical protein